MTQRRDDDSDEGMKAPQAAEYLGIPLRRLYYYRYVLKGGPEPFFVTKKDMRFKRIKLDEWKKRYLSGRGV